jgi:predicted phosphoadenosine phosphosulfate sulfurtransferase
MSYLKIFRNKRNTTALVLHDFKFSHRKVRLKIQKTWRSVYKKILVKPLPLHTEKHTRDKTDLVNVYWGPLSTAESNLCSDITH